MNKNDSKRKLLKSIAVGSGAVVAGKSLPESWSKPVVDAVMLPAHAATTDDTDKDPISPTTTQGCCDIAGEYCGGWSDDGDDEAGSFEIFVKADGSILVSLWDGEVTGTASVACTGGYFKANFSGDNYLEGTVVCDSSKISGTVYWFGAFKYEASECLR